MTQYHIHMLGWGKRSVSIVLDSRTRIIRTYRYIAIFSILKMAWGGDYAVETWTEHGWARRPITPAEARARLRGRRLRPGAWDRYSLLIGAAVLLAVAAISPFRSTGERAHRDASGRVVRAGEADIASLRVGDCIADNPRVAATEIAHVHVVSCAEPHAAEVYNTVDLPTGNYPGVDTVAQLAQNACDAAAGGASVVAAAMNRGATFSELFPGSADSWGTDNTALCLVSLSQGLTRGDLLSNDR